MKILFLQTGDYLEAWRRFEAGSPETYHEQKRTVEFVAAMAPDHEVTVATLSKTPHDTRLAPGLRTLGVSLQQMYAPGFGRRLIEEVCPDAFLPRLPHIDAIEAAAARRIPTLPCLADVMTRPRARALVTRSGLAALRRNRRLSRVLAAPAVTAIGNHSLLASRSLHEVLGLARDRIVPWEWTRLETGIPPRRHAALVEPPTVLFVGTHTEAKGAGDLLEAALMLLGGGLDLRVVLAGDGPERAAYLARVEAAHESARILLPGRIPKDEVRALMRRAAIAVMPSRPAYAEGLPNTVVEGLAHGLPLVVSDHPSVKARLRHETDCLIFRAGDPGDLAAQIRRLLEDPPLYDRISAHAAAAYDRLFVGLPWYDLVGRFLADPDNRTGWVRTASLAAVDP
ncbi:glycosyltransferase family 4 protein [Rhodovulum kholense]|uniref:Glycosyltransferase involved in cell wall biosynthesis n=1 Tax=Rhodovulum kholense TaxID=453584 RepID=A0A8E2VGV6_9RHOB|nr:glycosyltransferase family 4 protein [Rhodovulum kholense]PTW44055.1 glycosyltransferase involved in cell wall biosynthesis [Rhodovulum kholense]